MLDNRATFPYEKIFTGVLSQSDPCIESPPLDREQIHLHLGNLRHAFDVRVLQQCDSTSTRLIEDPADDDGRIQVIAAEIQHAGRGRRGRPWQAWPGGSLTFSVRWTFGPEAQVPAGLSLAAGLAVACVLEARGIVGVQLKWPNDVLVLGEKLAGILVELQPGRQRKPVAVIGIGINMRLPPEISISGQNGVTDLHSHLPTPSQDRNEWLAALLTQLHSLFDTYANAGFTALQGAWQQRNAFANLPVMISGEGGTVTGICEGVDENGALLLRTDTGVNRILSGEVSLRANQP